jgi:hypothetical protein
MMNIKNSKKESVPLCEHNHFSCKIITEEKVFGHLCAVVLFDGKCCPCELNQEVTRLAGEFGYSDLLVHFTDCPENNMCYHNWAAVARIPSWYDDFRSILYECTKCGKSKVGHA